LSVSEEAKKAVVGVSEEAKKRPSSSTAEEASTAATLTLSTC